MTKACSPPEMALRGGASGTKPAAVGVPDSLTCSAGASSDPRGIRGLSALAKAACPPAPAHAVGRQPGAEARSYNSGPHPAGARSGVNPGVPVTAPVGRKDRDEVHTLEALNTGLWHCTSTVLASHWHCSGVHIGDEVHTLLRTTSWVAPSGCVPGPAGLGRQCEVGPTPGTATAGPRPPSPRARHPAQLVRAPAPLRPIATRSAQPMLSRLGRIARHRFYEVRRKGAPRVRRPGMRGGGR